MINKKVVNTVTGLVIGMVTDEKEITTQLIRDRVKVLGIMHEQYLHFN